MERNNNDFLKKLLETFRTEAQEHIASVSSCLMDLEKTPAGEDHAKIIENVFREVHSLKGASRAVNAREMENICQSLEDIFGLLKNREVNPSREMLDVLHQATDILTGLLSALQTPAARTRGDQVDEIIRRLRSIAKEPPRAKDEPASQELRTSGKTARSPEAGLLLPKTETVRTSAAKLDALMLQVEELLATKTTLGQSLSDLHTLNSELVFLKAQLSKTQQGIRSRKISSQEISDFLDRSNLATESIERRLSGLAKSSEQNYRSFDRTFSDIREEMKEILLLSVASFLNLFPKLVRDMSRDLGKEAELTIQGGEIEIDRQVLEHIKDPLIHLVRNCIDHGIEKPEERTRKNKPICGRIILSVSIRNGRNAEIQISDDGAGVNLEKVKSAGVQSGTLTVKEAEKMTEKETIALIFQSGISTSRFVTDLSGRGLGLAIVREKLDEIGGTVTLESKPGEGTVVSITIPLTLTAFRGVLVRWDEYVFVFPLTNIEHVRRVKKEEIRTVENCETIRYRDETIPLVRLGQVLGVPKKNEMSKNEFWQAVILASAGKRIAFMVDEILTEQEIPVKTFGRQLARVQNFSGATVLADGKVAPILNIPDLMKSAASRSGAPIATPAPSAKTEEKKRILVVEDSVTARSLLKNILESAGYDVRTAVDGIDAITSLKAEMFDLVVSDVDMPRMNGFELTEKIRSEKKLTEIPVILVTALESKDDRERGLDVGANAYIIKRSFAQSNLLETIGRLL